MKKVTTLFFLFTLIILSYYNNENDEKTILVNYIEENSYQKVYLKFENNILNTNNFEKYFTDDTKVISIYILKNKYDCILGMDRYLFRFEDLNNNMEGYKKYYINLFDINSYEYFKGIPISIVEVDISSKELNKVLNMNKNVKYSTQICGNYQ